MNMKTFLRVIRRADHYTLYDRGVVKEEFHLDDNEYPSDILDDYYTDSGVLSVYEVKKDDPSSIQFVVCAVAATSNSYRDYAFILFDDDIFKNLNIEEPIKKPGKTASPIIDEMHYDVNVITTQNLLELAHQVANNGMVELYLKREMKDMLKQYYSQKLLPKIEVSLKKKLT
ncbi:hypothetical protein ES703_64990 [subsurface metagenome]